MTATYLCLTWTDHLQVTKEGGKKATRDYFYHDLLDSKQLLSRVLKRVRSAFGPESPMVNKQYKEYHAAVAEALERGEPVKHTIKHKGRPLVSYEVKPFAHKLSFSVGASDYMVMPSGKVKKIGGSPSIPIEPGKVLCKVSGDAVKVDLKAKPRSKLPKVEVKPKVTGPEIAEGSFCKLPKGDTKPPFTPGKSGPEVKDNEKAWMDRVTPKPKQTPSGKVHSKAVLTECEKFKVDPDNPPADKPSGFQKKLWRRIIK